MKYFLDRINFHQKSRIFYPDSENLFGDIEELKEKCKDLEDNMWTTLKKKNWKRLTSLAADIQHFLFQVKESRAFLNYSFDKELEEFGDNILKCESKFSF